MLREQAPSCVPAFRSARATSATNLNVPDRLFKVHGRWKSDSSKDGYVHDKLEPRLYVPLHIDFNLFSFCKSEFRFILYFSITYTSVSCKLCFVEVVLYHCRPIPPIQ